MSGYARGIDPPERQFRLFIQIRADGGKKYDPISLSEHAVRYTSALVPQNAPQGAARMPFGKSISLERKRSFPLVCAKRHKRPVVVGPRFASDTPDINPHQHTEPAMSGRPYFDISALRRISQT